MCRNGVEFGVRVSGTGDQWFTGTRPSLLRSPSCLADGLRLSVLRLASLRSRCTLAVACLSHLRVLALSLLTRVVLSVFLCAAPSPVVNGLYFPGYGPKDANPDLGDSSITETLGIGGRPSIFHSTGPHGVPCFPASALSLELCC